MVKRNTTPKQSSGGGYQFENKVAAYFLAHLLARSTPFDPPGGLVEHVDMQRPATEWHLDDLLVTVRVRSRLHRLSFSVKSNPQITSSKLPSDFVRDAWEQLLHDSSDVFREGEDYLGLLTVPLDTSLRTSVQELLQLARHQPPEDLATQVGLAHRANETIRDLHESAKCPDDLASKHGLNRDVSAGRLLRHVLWAPFDFEDVGSTRRTEALRLCQNLLRSGSADEGHVLWERLKEVANQLRRSGGGTGLSQLIRRLRGRFELRDFPDHVADWSRVDDDTQSALARVRSTIGGTVTLPRSDSHEALSKAFSNHSVVVLLGASGTGKSAVAKSRAAAAMEEGKALWLDAERLSVRSLSEWRTHLGLAHSLDELIDSAPVNDALIVLDGLDRLYDDNGFASVGEFIRAAEPEDPASPWRLLVTCTAGEWGRVQEELASQGLSLHSDSAASLNLPPTDELEAVWEAFPALSPLRSRYRLAPVLFRPKVLDLLASHVAAVGDLSQIGESDLARLFVDREIATGKRATSRVEVAYRIAESFADELQSSAPSSALLSDAGIENTTLIDELIGDRILTRSENRIAFAHDLYADWVRTRRLRDAAESGELTDFLGPRISSPIWHRALRLYGTDLLEQNEDLSSWRHAFDAAASLPGSAGVLAQDLLLESTAFADASSAGPSQEDLWTLLTEDEGDLLTRLLRRLLHVASVPNTVVVDAVTERSPELAVHAAAGSRVPYWPRWIGILSLLHRRRNEIPVQTLGLAARVAELWLRFTEPEWPLRDEAAAIAVTLGDALLKEKEEQNRLFLDRGSDRQVYRAVLSAGHEEPDRVEQIVLEAAGRRDKRFAPPPLTEEERAQVREKEKQLPTISFGRSISFGRLGPLRDPWPHGPAFRVDKALQETVLETDALALLAQALPDTAREALLALLISEPKRQSSFHGDSLHERYGLERPNWHPQFYTRGPFLAFLRVAEEEAISAIIQLVNHATDRWAEARARRLARDRELPIDEVSASTIPIEVEGKMKEYVGNRQVFGWSRDSPDRGKIVGSALLALEKHLYDQADAGEDLTPIIQRLLQESHSVAVIGVLSVFACRHPRYLTESLRGLLGSLHVLQWTISGSVDHTWKFSISHGFSPLPEPLHDEYRKWHEMPHRKASLREIAVTLLVRLPELRPYFEDVRERLQDGMEPGGPYEHLPLVENLVEQFDWDNYNREENEDGGIYFRYEPPAELQRKHAEMQKVINKKALVMRLPLQCRRILDGEESCDEDTLEQLWSHVQQIGEFEWSGEERLDHPSNALAGVAAVILLKGEGWLEENPDRKTWAHDILFATVHEDRSLTGGGVARQDRLMFAAETFPAIWAEDPRDQNVREAVGKLAMEGTHTVVSALTSHTVQFRERLGEDHPRLVNAILLRAAIDSRIRSAEQQAGFAFANEEKAAKGEKKAEVAREELKSIERGLVEGTLGTSIPSLDDIAPIHQFDENERSQGVRGRRRIPYRPINDSLVVAAFQGLPILEEGEENAWLDVWVRAVHETLGPLAQPTGEASVELDGTPGVWDHYLVRRVATVVANTPDLDAAERLWRPIIELGNSAKNWVTGFTREWTTYTLYPDASEHVVASWIAMIDVALDSPRWAGDSKGTHLGHPTGELWRTLLGFDNYADNPWTEELQPRVRHLRPQIEAWAQTHLANHDNARSFARFLVRPAAAELVLPGIVWLHEAEAASGTTARDRSDTDAALLLLLAYAWRNAQTALRRDPSVFSAFRGLLGELVAKQYGPALELADRVAATSKHSET